ncbi:GrpB family protein [Actinomadura sp. 6N118]|uniref:GrpB family protein n=1 Tax=Actinomadura sp. 6N118 TaxID=3375151 RepID=UPI0037AD9D31
MFVLAAGAIGASALTQGDLSPLGVSLHLSTGLPTSLERGAWDLLVVRLFNGSPDLVRANSGAFEIQQNALVHVEWEEAWLGLAKRSLRVMDSQSGWSEVYEQLASALRPALGALAIAIEHVGSTSVPGLPAKPIVDIAVGLAADAQLVDVVDAVTALGYEFRGDKGEEIGWLFVLETRPLYRVAHVHAVRHGGLQWREYLAFRDRLRADPAAHHAYAQLKRQLAVSYGDDRQAYTAAKTSLVRELLSGA